MENISSTSGQINQNLPLWVGYIRDLGLPALVGVIVGALINVANSFVFDSLHKKEKEKERREKLATEIISTIKAYNVIHSNNYGQLLMGGYKPEKEWLIRQKLMEGIERYNEMEAKVSLNLPEHWEKEVEDIKTLILKKTEEIDSLRKKGITQGQIYDLETGKEYMKKFKEIRDNLKKWINS